MSTQNTKTAQTDQDNNKTTIRSSKLVAALWQSR